jgi:hypothetical protein
MKKILINSVLIALFALLFTNCKDTVDLQAPFEENVYIFGMLDARQSTQKIKIYKVFTGANPSKSAQILDSIYFKPGELDVKLEVFDLVGNKSNNSIPLLYANNSTLSGGGSFNPNDAVYYYTNSKLSVDSLYKLVVKTKTNKIVESELVKMCDTVRLVQPESTGFRTFNGSLISQNDIITDLDTTKSYKIKLAKAKDKSGKLKGNVKGMNCKLNFTYNNYGASLNLLYKRSLVYNLKNVSFTTNSVDEVAYLDVRNVDFLRYWGQMIKDDDPNVTRRIPESMDFTFTAYDKETETYIAAQNETTGLSQEKLSYSNIKNGQGFLGSRNTVTYFRTTNIGGTMLEKSVYTRNLKFRDK